MLGYADYALTTALPIGEVRHRIVRHLVTWRFGELPRKAVSAPSEVFFIGYVFDRSFRLMLPKEDSEDSPHAVARGRLIEQPGGTRIEVQSSPPLASWLLAGMFGLFGLPCVAFAAIYPIFGGFGWEALASLLVGLAFLGVTPLVLSRGRQESIALRDKLAALVEAGAPAGELPRS
jgi:hypothetical protein